MQKTILIYIGILVGNLVMHFSVNWSEYLEGVYIPPLVRFLFIGILLVTQLTIFLILMFFFAKKFYSEILRSPYTNFFIGFLFTVFYILFSIVFVSSIEILNNNWFIYVIAPITILSALIYSNHLLFSFKKSSKKY